MTKMLMLPLALILFVAPMADDLLTEDFEAGTQPADWQVWEENTCNYSWYFFNDASGQAHGGSDGYAVRYNDSFNVDSWLVTPTLDMSTYENLSISLWQCDFGSTTYVGNYIMGTNAVSPSASDFVQLSELGDAPPNWTWAEATADASVFDFNSTVTFAVRYTGQYSTTLYIDDVLVTGDLDIGIEAAALGEIKAIYK